MSKALEKLNSKLVRINVVSDPAESKINFTKAAWDEAAIEARETFTDEDLEKVRNDILQRAITRE